MRKPLRHVTLVLLGCFLVLFVQLNRVQVFDAQALEDFPGNTRKIQRLFNQNRGSIFTADGVVVAESQATTPGSDFKWRRRYPQGELYAHSVGYISLTQGASGVEEAYSDKLVGAEAITQIKGLFDSLEGGNKTEDVILTLDHNVQVVAKEALGNRNGSVVAIDPKTGDIKALWSFPSYNPDPLASLNSSEVQDALERINNGNERPNCSETSLCAKAYEERYFPGSTFKVVTAATGLDEDAVDLDRYRFPDETRYVPPPSSVGIPNFGNGVCGGTLKEMITRSCNAGFGRLAVELLGPEKMVAGAERFGFNKEIPFDLDPVATSNFPVDYGEQFRKPTDEIPAGIYDNSPRLGRAAIGQDDVQASPLHMAMVAAAIADDGKMKRPNIVAKTVDSEVEPDFSDIRGKEQQWLEATERGSARDIREAMRAVVSSGTATNLQMPGLDVGAKTGTAQIGSTGSSHAWVIAFAGPQDEDPELAVAVIVESQQETGGAAAAPIAKQVFEEFFR